MPSVPVLSPTLELVGFNSWRGTAAWACLSSQALGEMRRIANSGHPKNSAARCSRVRALWNPHGMKGLALLVAHYGGQAAAVRQVQKARILVTTKGLAGKLNKAIVLAGHAGSGKTIEGPDQHGDNGKPDGIHEWEVVRGSNVRQHLSLLLKIQTAFYARDFKKLLSDLDGLYDTVNSDTLAELGWQPGTVRFVGMSSANRAADDIVNVDVLLWYYKPGWNNLTQSQPGFWGVLATPVYEMQGQSVVKTDEMREIRHFFGGYKRSANGTPVAVAPESRPMFAATSYSVLNNMMRWWVRG